MTFYSGFSDLKQIHSYLGADSYFQQTKPVRGKPNDYRPLRSNRRDHQYKSLSVRKTPNGETYYAARLYQTDLIEYHPNHLIVNTTTNWTSTSTKQFFEAVLPDWVQVTTHKDGWWARIARRVDGISQWTPWFKTRMDHKLKIQIDSVNGYTPTQQTIHVSEIEMRGVDRKDANALYKPYKEFFAWVNAMDAMEALAPIVCAELKCPLEWRPQDMADMHSHRANKSVGDYIKDYLNTGRDNTWKMRKELLEQFVELASAEGLANPANYPSILTLYLCATSKVRSSYWCRVGERTLTVDANAKSIKTSIQKFLVDSNDTYVWSAWKYGENGNFPTQPYRVIGQIAMEV